MDVQAFFPARYAELTEGGLNIIGGGFPSLNVNSWPLLFRNIAVVAKILLDRDDDRETHTLAVRLLDPGDTSIFETDNFPLRAGAISQGMDYFNVNLALGLTNVLFVREGRYWFELLYDGNIVKRAPLFLKSTPVEEPATVTPQRGEE